MPASNEPSGIDALRAFGLRDLLELRDAVRRRIDEYLNDAGYLALQESLSDAQKVLAEKLRPFALNEFGLKGKTSGEVTFETDGAKAKASVSKKVEWDQVKLKALAGELPWSSVQQLFKIEFSVPEAIYKATIDGDLRAALNDARTTKLGDLKISVERA